ncbi:suppressor of fused domain protein [Nonomuraea antimicrobica]|uniref:suppressor of fused domain protein n=1 Tax=Nonomuraea antimicrobica TaxID=561173 RepID=UPI0031F000CF
MQDDLLWEVGPIKERLPDFQIRRVHPLGPGHGYMYFSVGAFASSAEPGWEFFIKAPTDSMRHVETLAVVAHYHAFPQHRLSPGSIVDLGRPWSEGSEHRHLLVSWPHSLDTRTATCATALGEITFLWLVAISESEAAFARRFGVDPLEDRLESAGVNVIDPLRESVV